MILIMSYSGSVRTSRIRVRLLSSSGRIWSSEMIMLYRSAFFTAEWMVRVKAK